MNFLRNNKNSPLFLSNTTDSIIFNNIFIGNSMPSDNGLNKNNEFSLKSPVKIKNIVGGPEIAGNYYSSYNGKDNGSGFGSTPFNNQNLMNPPDYFPLICQDKRLCH